MIARMQLKSSAWSLMFIDRGKPNVINKLLRTGAIYEITQAKNPVGFILIDVIGEQCDLEELWNYFTNADKRRYGPGKGFWEWRLNGKAERDYPGRKQELLAVQGNFIEYDEEGLKISEMSPSETNPNWGHRWLGQGDLELGEDVVT